MKKYFIGYKFILIEWNYILVSCKNYFCNILATISEELKEINLILQ